MTQKNIYFVRFITLFWLISIYNFCTIIIKVKATTIIKKQYFQQQNYTTENGGAFLIKNYTLISKNIIKPFLLVNATSLPFYNSILKLNNNFTNKLNLNISNKNHHIFISLNRNRKQINDIKSTPTSIYQINDEAYHLLSLDDKKVFFLIFLIKFILFIK